MPKSPPGAQSVSERQRATRHHGADELSDSEGLLQRGPRWLGLGRRSRLLLLIIAAAVVAAVVVVVAAARRASLARGEAALLGVGSPGPFGLPGAVGGLLELVRGLCDERNTSELRSQTAMVAQWAREGAVT